MISTSDIIEFDLPTTLACPSPTELREIERDEVRLLVTTGAGNIYHKQFRDLVDFLQAGDVLVVNTSSTLPAAIPVDLPGSRKGVIHFSTPINARERLIEIREIQGNKTSRWSEGKKGMRFDLYGNAHLQLKENFYDNRSMLNLWVAQIDSPIKFHSFLSRYGQPIQYENLGKRYPLEYYQTFFSTQPGSSEMPSAGRGFTEDLVHQLMEKGIRFAPILLHTGISSLEDNEEPYPEYYEIDPVSAAQINLAKQKGKRIIGVGTTAIRALESSADPEGNVVPYRGMTELYIQHDQALKVIDGLITGFHEPKASHLHMLQALAGKYHIRNAYSAALEAGYYWHQFGDLHLILPNG